MPATPIHWTPLSADRARHVLALSARVLRDSNETLAIVEVEEITAQAQLDYLIERGVFDTDEGRALLRDRPHLADLDVAALRALPNGTLGREWARFLDEHGLAMDVTKQPTPYTDDPDQAYLLQRIRQAHDLWHALLGVGTAGHEEILVHAFSLAQTGLPSSVAIVVLGGLKHIVGEGRWRCLREELPGAYRRGVRAKPLLAVYWERHLSRPLDEVRAWLGLEPMPGAPRPPRDAAPRSAHA